MRQAAHEWTISAEKVVTESKEARCLKKDPYGDPSVQERASKLSAQAFQHYTERPRKSSAQEWRQYAKLKALKDEEEVESEAIAERRSSQIASAKGLAERAVATGLIKCRAVIVTRSSYGL